jgi:hypothetical protein
VLFARESDHVVIYLGIDQKEHSAARNPLSLNLDMNGRAKPNL